MEGYGTEPDSTEDIDNCLDILIGTLDGEELLDRTVVIILNRAEGQVMVIHPDRAGYTTVSEATTDADILATILALGIPENGETAPLPEGLKGRDLLSLSAVHSEGH